MAVDKITTSLILRGDDKSLALALKKSERGIKRFGSTVQRTGVRLKTFGTRLRRAFNVGGAGFGGAGIGGLLGGAAFVFAGKKIIEFTGELGKLSVQADLTKAEVFRLKNSLNELALPTFQKPGDLLGGVAAIVERTGNIKFATDVIEQLGIIATATSSHVRDIGFAASDLNDKLKIDPSQITQGFDILATQGKQGAFELDKMAEKFPRLLAAAAGFGVRGLSGLRRFGGLLQIAMIGTGDPDVATTAVENVLTELVAKSKLIKEGLGFDIFDREKEKKTGKEVIKDLDVILKEVIKRSEGRLQILQQIFGRRAIRAIKPLATAFRETGGFERFDRLINVIADGSVIMDDYSKRIQFADQQFKKLGISMEIIKQVFLLKPIKDLARALDSITPKLAKISKLPFFDRSLWVAIGTGMAGLLAGIGFFVPAAVGAAGFVAGGFLGEEIKKNAPFPPTKVSRSELTSMGLPVSAKTVTTGIAPTGKFQFLRDILKQTININVSDKQISVQTDNGAPPQVNLDRGPLAGAVP